MAIELSSNAQRWLGRLPDLANIVLIALIALALAHVFWMIWPQPAVQAIAPAQNAIGSASATPQQINVNAIADAHIFGQKQSVDINREKEKELNAPETHLNLVLTGIIDDSQAKHSRAFIQTGQGKQDSYRIGQTILSGVALHAIFPDRVILERGGHFETLTLESLKNAASFNRTMEINQLKDGSSSIAGNAGSQAMSASTNGTAGQSSTTSAGQPPPNQSANAGNAPSDADVASQLAAIRQKIIADPGSVQRYIRLQPARQNGNLVGYRVYPGEDKILFQKAGLESGELVTAINGQPLNDPAASLKMLGHLENAQSATITVQSSDGQSRNVRVDF